MPLPPCGGRLSVCSLKMVTVPPGAHRVHSARKTGWWLPHQTVQTASAPHTSPAGQRRSRDPLKKTLQPAQDKERPGQEACGRCRRWANLRLQCGERTDLGQCCPLPAARSEASTPERGLPAGKPHPTRSSARLRAANCPSQGPSATARGAEAVARALPTLPPQAEPQKDSDCFFLKRQVPQNSRDGSYAALSWTPSSSRATFSGHTGCVEGHHPHHHVGRSLCKGET